MSEPRHVRLFRNGRNQAVRIPVEFELPGTEVTIRKEGKVLIIEPAVKDGETFLDVIKRMEPLTIEELDVFDRFS